MANDNLGLEDARDDDDDDMPSTDAVDAAPSARPAALAALAERWGVRGLLRSADRALLRHAATVPPAEMTPLVLAALEQHPEFFAGLPTAEKLRQMISLSDDWQATSMAARSLAQALEDETTRARAAVARLVLDVYKVVVTVTRRRLDEGRLDEIEPRMRELMRIAQGRGRSDAHKEAVAADRAVKIARRREQLKHQEMAARARAEKMAEKMRKELEGIERQAERKGGRDLN